MSQKTVKITLLKNNRQIADQCVVAATFWDRLVGLMGRRELPEGHALMLEPCNDIHMWFMKIPIDVVFVEKTHMQSGTILKVTSVRVGVRPWRLLPLRDGKATITLELPIHTIRKCDIRPGDDLCIS